MQFNSPAYAYPDIPHNTTAISVFFISEPLFRFVKRKKHQKNSGGWGVFYVPTDAQHRDLDASVQEFPVPLARSSTKDIL